MKHILHKHRTLGVLEQKTRNLAACLVHTPTIAPKKRDGWIL